MWWFIGSVIVLLFAAAGWLDWKRSRAPGDQGAGQSRAQKKHGDQGFGSPGPGDLGIGGGGR
jgi:hypothetical protein